MKGKEKIGNFIVTKKLGEGAFGEIWHGIHAVNRNEVAIKIEFSKKEQSQLAYEAKLYSYLHNDASAYSKGIPKIYEASKENGMMIMVMDLLGLSLEDYFNVCNRKFPVKTVIMLAEQIFSVIEYLHSRGIVHRDIKPDNFMMGAGKNEDKLFLIDFGLAKKIISGSKHIEFRDGKSLTGTARYASINNHCGYEQSRRDDLESIGYMFYYFLRGKLPWQDLPANNTKEKFQKILEKKMTIPVLKLGAGFPKEFETYLNYCKNLKFAETPDYEMCKNLFLTLFLKEGYKYDGMYEWKIIKDKTIEAKKIEEVMQNSGLSKKLDQSNLIISSLNTSNLNSKPNQRVLSYFSFIQS